MEVIIVHFNQMSAHLVSETEAITVFKQSCDVMNVLQFILCMYSISTCHQQVLFCGLL